MVASSSAPATDQPANTSVKHAGTSSSRVVAQTQAPSLAVMGNSCDARLGYWTPTHKRCDVCGDTFTNINAKFTTVGPGCTIAAIQRSVFPTSTTLRSLKRMRSNVTIQGRLDSIVIPGSLNSVLCYEARALCETPKEAGHSAGGNLKRISRLHLLMFCCQHKTQHGTRRQFEPGDGDNFFLSN